LVDPFSNLIRYIGKTERPEERLKNHCNERSRNWRSHWIQKLLTKGARPTLIILEQIPEGANWEGTERSWIAKGRAMGWPLTNCTDGGDGVKGMPPESIHRRNTNWIGRKHRPETLLKIGAASKLRRWTDERRERMSLKFKGRAFSPEWRAKISEKSRKLTPEQIREIRGMLQNGESQTCIGRLFKVDRATIANVHFRRFYADIPD
jgi:Helix-turn-helix domain